MSKSHHQQGAESMGGGNSGRRIGAKPIQPIQQKSAGLSSRKIDIRIKKGAFYPGQKAA